jgi:glucan biosynthesis protein
MVSENHNHVFLQPCQIWGNGTVRLVTIPKEFFCFIVLAAGGFF